MTKSIGPAPTVATLKEAALRHISRYSVTEAGLARVLGRRVQRWAREAALEGQEIASSLPTAQAAARHVAKLMATNGLVNDAVFASARSARLTRAGRSFRAIAADLAKKGITAETAQTALPEPEQEISAAVAFARRRRLGPFRVLTQTGTGTPEERRRELAAFARAGFTRDVAERALRMPIDAADQLLLDLKQALS